MILNNIIIYLFPYFRFPVERWLDEDEGDGLCGLNLIPGVKPPNHSKSRFIHKNWLKHKLP